MTDTENQSTEPETAGSPTAGTLWPGLTPAQVVDGPAPWFLDHARERFEGVDRDAMIRQFAEDRVCETRRFDRQERIAKELRTVFERVCGSDAYPDGNYACGELAMIRLIDARCTQTSVPQNSVLNKPDSRICDPQQTHLPSHV